jgi:transcriptional regulator with XRE-family HTH domain
MNTSTTTHKQTAGDLLRAWRQQRRLSQLALATDAEISQRHLSFIESGRAAPSRDMVLRLAEQLDLPLRERNALLLRAGYAPVYGERRWDDPDAADVRRVVEQIVHSHEPVPALAVDRHWHLLTANGMAMQLLGNVAPALLQSPINVLRVSLHPDGLAPQIVNFPEWRRHILTRLAHQAEHTGDTALAALRAELAAYPLPANAAPAGEFREFAGLAVPLQLRTPLGVLSLLGTTTLFGTPTDVMLSEIAIEAFFPADAATASLIARRAGTAPGAEDAAPAA